MRSVIACLMTFAIIGCGKKKEETKYGNIKAKFANTTALTALASLAPSEFLVKLKYIIVVEDKTGYTEEPSAANNYGGNNSGKAIRVWVNPKCTSTTLSGDGGSFSDIKTDDECETNGMTYFDLNRTSAAVNADLNSQGIQAEVGTYRYVSMAFLGEQAGGLNTKKNIKWAHAATGTTTQEYADFQTEFTAKFDTPITLAEGQTITFNLKYDLASIVTTGLAGAAEEKVLGSGTTQPGKYHDCESTKSVCMNLPAYTLSVDAQ